MKKLIAKNPADPRNDLKDLLKAAQWRLEKMEAPSRALKAKHIRINMIQCCGYRTKLTSQWMIRDDSSARYDQMCGLFLVPQFFVLCFVCVLPPLPCPCLEVLMISSHRWWHQSGWCRMSKWSIWGVVIITSWQTWAVKEANCLFGLSQWIMISCLMKMWKRKRKELVYLVFSQQMYTPINQHSWLEYGPFFFDVVPMENGDIQGSYVSLPEDAMTVDSWDARL